MKGITVILVALLISSCDYISSPKSYDDCILDNLKGTKSDKAAVLIRKSCKEKFPKSTEDERARNLSNEEMLYITGKGSAPRTDFFLATFTMEMKKLRLQV